MHLIKHSGEEKNRDRHRDEFSRSVCFKGLSGEGFPLMVFPPEAGWGEQGAEATAEVWQRVNFAMRIRGYGGNNLVPPMG